MLTILLNEVFPQLCPSLSLIHQQITQTVPRAPDIVPPLCHHIAPNSFSQQSLRSVSVCLSLAFSLLGPSQPSAPCALTCA